MHYSFGGDYNCHTLHINQQLPQKSNRITVCIHCMHGHIRYSFIYINSRNNSLRRLCSQIKSGSSNFQHTTVILKFSHITALHIITAINTVRHIPIQCLIQLQYTGWHYWKLLSLETGITQVSPLRAALLVCSLLSHDSAKNSLSCISLQALLGK